MVKRGIKGPGWLSILRSAIVETKSVLGSGLCLVVNNFKAVAPSTLKLGEPLLRVLSFSAKFVRPKDLKTPEIIGGARSDNEPVMICLAGAVNDKFNTDISTREASLRMRAFVLNPTKARLNCKSKGTHTAFLSEEEMINNFLAWLADEDPDFIVCHDVYSNSLDLLISRAVKKNIRNISLLARLANACQLKNDNSFRRKENAARGRLIVDTFTFAKEQYRLKDYSLSSLSAKLSESLTMLGTDEMKSVF